MTKKTILIATVAVIALAAAGGAYYWQQTRSPMAIAKKVVLAGLHDPDSAIFENFRQSTKSPAYWCGAVNAKNRLGGYVGFQNFVLEIKLQDFYPTNRDEALMMGDLRMEGSQGFPTILDAWCTP